MHERFTNRARKVMFLANQEAHHLNHEYFGTEHLLLGLLRETDGVAAQTLTALGLKLEDTRRMVLTLLGADTPEAPLPLQDIEPPHKVDYRNLDVWKKADELAHAVYKVAGGFPREEIYGVGSHLRRTALLIPPNIAAAYRRSGQTDAQWFVDIALGLLRELRYGLDFAVKLGVLKVEEREEMANLVAEIDEDLAEFHAALAKPRGS